MKLKTLLTALSCLLASLWGHAQTPQYPNPIKVGLVLSGGGAKGLAHIGALKVIEAAGVQIDYIGGSSMGAIIGALYASGYSAKQLDSIFRTTNFTTLIQDDIPREAKTFYEKENAARYALSLPFTGLKISLPQALSGGQNLYNELVQLLFHVKDVRDFTQLPIPFLCMATNVETGEEILLDQGYLPQAVMASGTLPSLFAPSEIDGALLIDGGVVNNYPIDHVKAKGANYTIGVDVQHGLASGDSLTSATAILMQINNYRTVAAMKQKTKDTDIYIRPDIDAFSVVDFSRGPTIVQRGETAAKAQWQALQQLAQRQNAPTLATQPISISDSLTLNRLILQGNEQYTGRYIKGKLRIKWGEKISFHSLKRGINNLYATGNFKSIRYQFRSGAVGTDLVLIVKENPTKTFLKMAVHYDDLYKSAVLLNLTKKNAAFKDDVASFDLMLGDNIRYALHYYVDKGYAWSLGLSAELTNFDKDIDFGIIRSNFYLPNNPSIGAINLDVTDVTNQFYLQTVLREEFAFTLGLEHKFLRYSTQTLGQIEDQNQSPSPRSSGETLFENSSYFSTYGQIVLDTYDDKYFPTRGLFFDSDLHLYLLSSDFNNNFSQFAIGQAKLGIAFPLRHNVSLTLETEGGVKLGTSAVNSFDFVLGGYGNDFVNNFIPFFGYDFISLFGNSFVKNTAKVDYRFAPKNHALLVANFAHVDDDLFQTGDWFTAPTFSGYSIGYGLESFLGPIQIHYSFTPETDDSQLFFSVGYWF